MQIKRVRLLTDAESIKSCLEARQLVEAAPRMRCVSFPYSNKCYNNYGSKRYGAMRLR